MNKSIVPDYIEAVLEKIITVSDPISVFLYGSMARDDFENDSDYEIGIVYIAKTKVSRNNLKEFNPYDNVKIYSFVYEELIKGEIDTPFPKYIYLKTIKESSVSLYGEDIKKIVSLPKLTKFDLFESLGFCLGRAYSAVVSSRQNDIESVRDGFTKSGLYGLQLLVLVKTGKFLSSYEAIFNESQKYISEEFIDLVKHVFDVRKRKLMVQIPFLYKNISFLNKVVLPTIKSSNVNL